MQGRQPKALIGRSGLLMVLISAVLAMALPLVSPLALAGEQVSGTLVNGLRVIAADEIAAKGDISVFRGDYIRLDLQGGQARVFSIPALDIEAELHPGQAQAPYFKMKKTGVYDYFLGSDKGTITVLEYEEAHYQALTAREAQSVMADLNPLILDVRTPGEYNAVRIDGSVLIPVQVLGQNLDRLAEYKDEPVLVYCATGNRSTVASKILIDNGFKRIFNLRHGIKDWQKQGLPVAK